MNDIDQPPEPESTAQRSRAGNAWARLANRWPEFLLEMISILIAVSLAFAVEQWRDDRERAEQAAALQQAVGSEMRSNADLLAESRQELIDKITALRDTVSAGQSPNELRVEFELASLSDVAYRALQASEAASIIDLQWRLQVARAYDTQQLVIEQQNRAFARLSDMAGAAPEQGFPLQELRKFVAELRLLLQLRDNLDQHFAALKVTSPSD